MNLSVAIGMNQDAVLYPVCAPHRFVHDMVVMPRCYVRDWLGAERANTALLFPQVGQGGSSLQGLFPLDA